MRVDGRYILAFYVNGCDPFLSASINGFQNLCHSAYTHDSIIITYYDTFRVCATAVHRIRVMLLVLLLLSFNKKKYSQWVRGRDQEWERWLCADTAQPQVALHADTFYLLFSEGLKEIFCLHIIFYQTFFPRRKIAVRQRCRSALGLAELLVWTRWWWTHTHNAITCLLKVIPQSTECVSGQKNKCGNSQNVNDVTTMKILCGCGRPRVCATVH